MKSAISCLWRLQIDPLNRFSVPLHRQASSGKRDNMTDLQEPKGEAPGKGSFCIPRAALNALVNNQATAYEICAYLVLARYTDQTGCYSSASLHAVNRYTGANKTKGGPVDRAINRLKTIRAWGPRPVSNGRRGKGGGFYKSLANRAAQCVEGGLMAWRLRYGKPTVRVRSIAFYQLVDVRMRSWALTARFGKEARTPHYPAWIPRRFASLDKNSYSVHIDCYQ